MRVSHRRQRTCRHAVRRKTRRPILEVLEARQMLAAEFQNSADPLDVTKDGRRTAVDTLRVFNYLVRNGSNLPEPAAGQQLTSYWDVNADNRVSANDALIVSNGLGESFGDSDHWSTGLTYLSTHHQGTVGDIEFQREDIVAFDSASGNWSLVMDGSDIRLHTAEIHASHMQSENELLITIDRGSSHPSPR